MVDTQTGIVVRTKVFPLAFLLLLFKTRVVIDGNLTTQKWGANFFPVAPGTHRVAVSFNYIFGEMGRNDITVDVAAGQMVEVHYRSPFIVFMKGKISAIAAAAPQG